MNGTSWLTLLVGIISGGAMGALIKILYGVRRDRFQPVARRVRVFPLFRRDSNYSDLHAVLTVTHDGKLIEYHTLFVADVAIRNHGNRDHQSFEFGLELEGKGECVHIGWEDPDQHHALKPLAEVSPSAPKAALKFRLEPFNRQDTYSLRLYLVPGDGEKSPKISQFTSPYPVRFIDSPLQVNGQHPLWINFLCLLLLC